MDGVDGKDIATNYIATRICSGLTPFAELRWVVLATNKSVFFFKRCLIFFYHIVSSWTWFRISLLFFQTMFDFFYHFFVFTFFIKIITTSSKGRETARSPKPAVSLPLNPSFFGHGLGRCPKNLLTSEIEVRSVSYEQIRVAFLLIQRL